MTDCVVNINLTVPVAGGGTAPATGYIQFRPTKRRDLEGEIVLPESFTVTLVDGAATVTLDPTVDGDWCWRATERISKGRSWYFNVPEGPGPVDYDDLQEVDKDTLNPSAPIVPVWKQYVDVSIATAVDDAVTALLDGTPGALDTLNELAAALGDDANFAATVTAALATKATTAALDAEADLARNADNLTEGTIPDDRVSATFARFVQLSDAMAAEEAARNAAVTAAIDTAISTGSRLAYAENATGVPTGYGSASADLAYCVIVVPPSPDRDLWIEWGTTFYATTVAHGTLKSMLYEVTGADTFRDYVPSDVSANGLGSADPHSSHRGSYFIGRTTTYRTFHLRLICTKKTGVTYPAGGVFNGYQGLNPKSWIGAFAR